MRQWRKRYGYRPVHYGGSVEGIRYEYCFLSDSNPNNRTIQYSHPDPDTSARADEYPDPDTYSGAFEYSHTDTDTTCRGNEYPHPDSDTYANFSSQLYIKYDTC